MDREAAIIARTLTDQPVEFDVQGRRYRLYPATLGKLYLVTPLIEALDIQRDNITTMPMAEMLRVVDAHRRECCRILAYHTLRTKADILSEKRVTEQTKTLFRDLSNDDIATLLLTVLKDNCTEKIVKATGIDKEADRLARVNKAKDKGGSFTFGGRSVWGALIDVACERYGWTLDYVVWGISHANLTLLLKDRITTIFLSDKERKKVRLPDDGDVISGDRREAVMRLVRESEAHPA